MLGEVKGRKNWKKLTGKMIRRVLAAKVMERTQLSNRTHTNEWWSHVKLSYEYDNYLHRRGHGENTAGRVSKLYENRSNGGLYKTIRGTPQAWAELAWFSRGVRTRLDRTFLDVEEIFALVWKIFESRTGRGLSKTLSGTPRAWIEQARIFARLALD